MKPTPAHKEFQKIMNALSHKHQAWQVFSDFCEMAALSLANGIIKSDTREQRYLDIVKRYEKAEVEQIARLFQITIDGVDLHSDFLGEMFMTLELYNKWTGQFFTPIDLSRMIAELNLHGIEETIKREGFFTALEPACGSGGMVIALASALYDKGINPQQTMHVTAIDLDPTAAHMAYIQMSLHGIPGAVFIGDTLRMEMRDCFVTPMHYMGFWDARLRTRQLYDSIKEILPESAPAALPEAANPAEQPEQQLTAITPAAMLEQLDLFQEQSA
jgi:hypothetical protein